MSAVFVNGQWIDHETGAPVPPPAEYQSQPGKGGILGTGTKLPKILQKPAASGPTYSSTFGDYTTLPERYRTYDAADEATYDKYMADLEKARFAGSAVPDVQSQAGLSDATRAAQTASMSMLKDRTGVGETGEEKLMRLMARQKMESEMKGERGAMADRLKARGAYGSGAELASQLSAQQNLATERQISELGAQANAQRRAMDALKQYSAQGLAQGQQDIALGGQKDAVSMFNAGTKRQDEQFKVKNAMEIADKGASAGAGVTRNKQARTDSLVGTDMNLTGAETGSKTAGVNSVNNTGARVIEQDEKDAGYIAANDPVYS